MGYGAFMKVKNDLSVPIHLLVQDVDCMYDGGEQGSNLSLFHDVDLQPGQSLPASGTQYIEAKASGGCAFAPSKFTLNVVDVGTIGIEDDSENYFVANNTDPNALSANINNSGQQAQITITVYT